MVNEMLASQLAKQIGLPVAASVIVEVDARLRSFSNAVRLSPATVCLVDEPRNEIEKLDSQHLGKSMYI
jgi:hypothetical protein